MIYLIHEVLLRIMLKGSQISIALVYIKNIIIYCILVFFLWPRTEYKRTMIRNNSGTHSFEMHTICTIGHGLHWSFITSVVDFDWTIYANNELYGLSDVSINYPIHHHRRYCCKSTITRGCRNKYLNNPRTSV